MYEWKKTSRSLQHIQSLLLHTESPFPLNTQCPKPCLRLKSQCVHAVSRIRQGPKNDVHVQHFRRLKWVGRIEVKLGEMALTSKLEHLKAHGPLSHYRSWSNRLYFLARSVWKDFVKWETSGSKITKTWNCLGRSQRKWELIANTIKDEQEGQPKLRKIEKNGR